MPAHRSRVATLLRSWSIFVVLIAAFQVSVVTLSARWWEHTNVLTARLTALALRLLGATARAEGRIVVSSVYTIEVIRECTALYPIALFVAAVLAYPCGWRAKLIGIGAGVPGLVAVNIVRLVVLCYVGRYFPERFESMHMLVAQSLMVFFTVLGWILWSTLIAGGHELRRA